MNIPKSAFIPRCQGVRLKFDVTTVDGERRTSQMFSGEPEETIEAFKKNIGPGVGIPFEQQALIAREHFMLNHRRLDEYVFDCWKVTYITVARYPRGHQNQ